MRRRIVTTLSLGFAFVVFGASNAFACGGLIAPGHAEVLRKASTLAAWVGGKEHYVTGFTFAGTASSFGYLIPLPGVPEKIEKGGAWTLERLEREVNPREFAFAVAQSAGAARGYDVEVLQQVKIDALDIKVLRGGGPDVAAWARKNGFPLDFNADKIFAHYGSQKAIFAAARFDGVDAKRRGLVEGEGQTIHFTIPTPGPWIPLRVLTMGKSPTEIVEADLFILTERTPTLSPGLKDMAGMSIVRQEAASSTLLDDLRGDEGMSWVPRSMTFTALKLKAAASTIGYDLSIDGARPTGAPSAPVYPAGTSWVWWLTVAALGTAALGMLGRTARTSPAS